MGIPQWSRDHRGELRVALAVPVATAVTWGAWLGWDREVRIDEVDLITGERWGPWDPWQGIGCALCLIAIAVVSALLLPPWIPPVVMTVTFTAGWAWWAASTDLYGGLGGVPLVLVSLAIGLTLITAVTRAVAKSLSR